MTPEHSISLTPPQAGLLECLHVDAERPCAQTLAALEPDDWTTLERLAKASRVSYQVRRRLERADLKPLAPGDVMDRLQGTVQAQTARYLRRRATLAELLRACNAQALPVMVLKGAHLAELVYDSPAAREMSDVDLLFKPDDLPRATRLFKQLCYAIPHDAQDLHELAPALKEYTLRHPRWGVSVDVHWSTTGDESLADELDQLLWRRAERLDIAGTQARAMSREDLLLHLCYHASHQHHFAHVGLRPLADLAALCRLDPPLDWDAIAHRAEQWGWRRGTGLSLALAKHCLGAAVPSEVLDRLTPQGTNADVPYVAAIEAMLTESSNEHSAPGTLHRIWSAPTLARRVSVALERLLPPTSQLIVEFGLSDRQQLPPRAWLYLRRIGRLIPRYGRRALEIARGDPRRLAELQRRQQLETWLKP
ncbi:hypothetical protein Thimo_3569 [Thioflavicoccus mobilis 8321]|uniref:Nucleotidyltransferase family protein n=1 Tax=Thioflavicoccus mobilis 8321 TaxID=765912 RepID=L0H1W0_9GAMM|nr:nucleotidyltransferase family protein [Thioflavicoccus mobilis]AGA92226.1 hypothetical protein Thimo_3569 [Thioflavicoccus mobilis 8321]